MFQQKQLAAIPWFWPFDDFRNTLYFETGSVHGLMDFSEIKVQFCSDRGSCHVGYWLLGFTTTKATTDAFTEDMALQDSQTEGEESEDHD